MNAGRRYLGLDDLSGKVFITSGLGGMSGAQPKASVIAGCISVTAEVSNTIFTVDLGGMKCWTPGQGN